MTDELPGSAEERAAYAAVRRAAIVDARSRAAAGKGRASQQRPEGIVLTAVLVIAVLVGTLAIMIYAR